MMPNAAMDVGSLVIADASFADKFLMVILGLSIVFPTVFLVAAVMITRKLDKEPDDRDRQS